MAEGLVYLLQRGAEFKIGRTKDLAKRLVTINTASGVRPKVVHTIKTPHSRELETYLKRRFRACRLNGEWYLLNDSSVRYIMSMTGWPVDKENNEVIEFQNKRHRKVHRRIFQNELSFDYLSQSSSGTDTLVKESARQARLTIIPTMTLQELLRQKANVKSAREFGEKLGLSRQQASGLWNGRDPLGLRLMRQIKQAYGISLDDLAEVKEAVPGCPRQRPTPRHKSRHPRPTPEGS